MSRVTTWQLCLPQSQLQLEPTCAVITLCDNFFMALQHFVQIIQCSVISTINARSCSHSVDWNSTTGLPFFSMNFPISSRRSKKPFSTACQLNCLASVWYGIPPVMSLSPRKLANRGWFRPLAGMKLRLDSHFHDVIHFYFHVKSSMALMPMLVC